MQLLFEGGDYTRMASNRRNTVFVTVYLLQTKCKLNQFVNGPLVFKLVGQLSIIQSEMVPFRNQAEWPSGLESGFTSSPNGMKAVQGGRTDSPWP